MQNPSKVNQPNLQSPLGKRKKSKGNLPYLRFRRKLRKNMW